MSFDTFDILAFKQNQSVSVSEYIEDINLHLKYKNKVNIKDFVNPEDDKRPQIVGLFLAGLFVDKESECDKMAGEVEYF